MEDTRVDSSTIPPRQSLLQHAWADIRRDLGHDSSATVPSHARRRFVRLACLIELAEQEYADLREQLGRYDGVLPFDTEHGARARQLDKCSLRALIRDSRRVRRIDREIVKRLDLRLGRAWVTDSDVERFRDINLLSVDAIDRALATRELTVAAFAVPWAQLLDRPLRPWEERYCARGVTLHYLWYVMLAESGDREAIARSIAMVEHVDSGAANEWAAQVLAAYSVAIA